MDYSWPILDPTEKRPWLTFGWRFSLLLLWHINVGAKLQHWWWWPWKIEKKTIFFCSDKIDVTLFNFKRLRNWKSLIHSKSAPIKLVGRERGCVRGVRVKCSWELWVWVWGMGCRCGCWEVRGGVLTPLYYPDTYNIFVFSLLGNFVDEEKASLQSSCASICIVFLTIVSSLDIMQRAFEFYVMHWKAKHAVAVVHLLSKQLQAMLHCKIIHVKALEKQPLPSLQCIFFLVYSFFLRQKIAEIGKICKAFFGKSIP